jgi:hypothetical protein
MGGKCTSGGGYIKPHEGEYEIYFIYYETDPEGIKSG